MKKLALIAALCVAAASLAAKTTLYEVGPFDRVSLFGNIDLVYTNNPDSIGIAAYDSTEDYSDAIEISNNKGHLTIKEVIGHDFGHLPQIRLYSDFLSKVSNEGNSDIKLNLSAATPTFSASLVGNGRIICDGIKAMDVSGSITTGNGTIVMRGKCTDASFKLTGTGIIQADELLARNVKCFALGTGTIGCHPVEKLDVRGVGSTKVYYLGEPTIKKVGSAKLIQISSSSEKLPEGKGEQMNVVEEAGEEEKEEEVEKVEVEKVEVEELIIDEKITIEKEGNIEERTSFSTPEVTIVEESILGEGVPTIVEE